MRCIGRQRLLNFRECVYQLFRGQWNADDAGRRGKDLVTLSAEGLCGCGAHPFARCHPDLAGRAIGVSGIDGNNTNMPGAALQMTAAHSDWSSLYAVGGEHGSSAGRLIGDGDGKIELAARFQSSFDGSEAKAARKRVLGEQRSLNHVRFYFIKR